MLRAFRHFCSGSRPPLGRVAVAWAVTAIVGLSAGAAGAGADEVLYATDFADPVVTAPEWGFAQGATTESYEDVSYTMVPGAYTVSHEGARNVWSGPTLDDLPDDQVVEATIAGTTGDPSLIAGVVCRGDVDARKGYGFFVGLDGYYSIGTFAKKSGGRILVNRDGRDRTDTVDPDGPNTVRGECTSVGKKKVRLTLTVNGEKVASAVDTTSPARIGPDVYVISEVSGADSSATVTYSQFSVSAS